MSVTLHGGPFDGRVIDAPPAARYVMQSIEADGNAITWEYDSHGKFVSASSYIGPRLGLFGGLVDHWGEWIEEPPEWRRNAEAS